MKTINNQLPGRNKEIIRRLYEDCLNTGMLEILDQFISEEYTGIRGEKGAAGFAEITGSVRTGFPDIQWQIQDLIAEDNKVVIHWIWTGTHLGTFGNFEATGKQVSNQGIAIYRFHEDKIISASLQTDRLGFLQQIGALPQEV